MNNRWSIWASVLMLAGILGLAAVHLETLRRQQTLPDKQNPADRSNQPFSLYNENGQLKSDQQLKREQQARLKADIAHLAGNLDQAPLFADILYGENWRQEVNKYITRQRLMDAAASLSGVSMLAGVIIGLTYHSQRVVPAVISKLSRSRKQTDSDIQTEQDIDAVIVSPDQTDADSNPRVRTGRPDDGHTNGTDRSSYSRWWQSPGQSLELKAAFATQAVTFSKDVEQPGYPARSEQMATLMSTEPVNNSLTELTQEVSAIRQFAAQQQDRVRQLQEGYDWTIIKRFCIRIIHCIDNLDSRIAELSRKDQDTQYLEDVRDELIFALESSGVEQFAPPIEADYKGQEKVAEAVKEREHTERADMNGKVAEVTKPGYRYVLNENDVKIVRTAQVKLYG